MDRFVFVPPCGLGSERKRVLGWLRDRLAARGVESFGSLRDASSSALTIYAEDGSVVVRLLNGDPCTILVAKRGEADVEYKDALAALEDALDGHLTQLAG